MSDNIDDFDLDMNSDEVADLTSWSNPCDGTHIYGVVFAGMSRIGKDETAAKGIRIVYQKIATVEKAKEGDLDAAVGSVFDESFTGNDMGKKILKLRLKQIFGEQYKGGPFRPYIDALQENKMSAFHLQLTTKIHKSTSGGQEYENVRIRDCTPVECMELPQGFEQFEYTPAE